MHLHHNPIQNQYPSIEEIDADLALLAGKTHAIRTYSMDSTLSRIPELANKHGLNVALGAWIDSNEGNNAQQVEQLITHLDHTRAELGMPVSTAEPWDIWASNPRNWSN